MLLRACLFQKDGPQRNARRQLACRGVGELHCGEIAETGAVTLGERVIRGKGGTGADPPPLPHLTHLDGDYRLGSIRRQFDTVPFQPTHHIDGIVALPCPQQSGRQHPPARSSAVRYRILVLFACPMGCC